MSKIAVHVRIEGRVQGVWFRAWTEKSANELGLTGWVRNCRDGTVEAVFCGAQVQVDQMIEQCHEGPSAAQVDRINVESEADQSYLGFEKRPTN
jgi:acylphosphatase